MAPEGDRKKRSGLTWFFTAPQPAFSSTEIARIFEDVWTLQQAEAHIRLAVRHGELHPYRAHVVNLYERCEVIDFIVRYHPASPGEMAAAGLLSGYQDLCIPAVLFFRILEAAKAGHCDYAISAATLPRFEGEPAVGQLQNSKYPSPHTPRVGSARPDLSNELPSLRSRIRKNSAPRRPTPRKGD